MKKFYKCFQAMVAKSGRREKKNTVIADEDLQQACTRLYALPRFQRGQIHVCGWDLEYLDAPSTASCLDILVNKGWNDFVTTKPQPVIIDCGANIGVSVLKYKRVYPDARITVFEPDPTFFKVLQRNLQVNCANDVNAIEAAVWTGAGTMPFFCEGADGSKIVPDPESTTTTIKVKTVNLADYINRPVDLLKVDIEGAEFSVIPHLKGSLKWLKNIIIECHLSTNKIGQFANLLQTLADANFNVAVNSYGAWRDLIRNPAKLPNEFDQYVLLVAWH